MGLSRYTLGVLVAGLSGCAPNLQDLIAGHHYTEALSAVARAGEAEQQEVADAIFHDLKPQVHLEVGQLALGGERAPTLSVLRVRVAGNGLPLQRDFLAVESPSPRVLPATLANLAKRVGETVPECYDTSPSELGRVVVGVLSLLSFGLIQPRADSGRVCPTQQDYERATPRALATMAQLHHGCDTDSRAADLRCTFDFLLPPGGKGQSPQADSIAVAFRFHFQVRLPATSRGLVGQNFTLARHYVLALPAGEALPDAVGGHFGKSFRPLTEVARRQ